MKRKFFKTFIFVLCMLLFGLTLNVKSLANSTDKTVILGGNTIGLKIETGVVVVGKYQVQTASKKVSPWKNSDILDGDKIIAFNDTSISCNNDLFNCMKKTKENNAVLTIERDNQCHKTNIDIVYTKTNDKSIGLYIKDRIIGIGTLTFIDPKTHHFASLGHGIYDENVSFGNVEGSINSSTIEGIKKSNPGEAGEKRAILTNKTYGTMKINKSTGIYGRLTNQALFNRQQIQIAEQKEVVNGPAKIYTVIEGEKIEAFDIKVTNVYLQETPNIKGIKYEVTDARLLDKTGGIIQGMSGSPIVQNGKLIGAVSHVTVDNPKIGFGVHATWMYDDCNAF